MLVDASPDQQTIRVFPGVTGTGIVTVSDAVDVPVAVWDWTR